MNNKTIEQNSGIEYVTVNEDTDLWIIDYDEKEARWKSDEIEWMRKEGVEVTYLGLDDIYSYLEDQGYTIDEESTEIYIKFE